MFQSILDVSSGNFTIMEVLLCSLASIVLGLIISIIFQYKNQTSKGLALTLVLLPALVQMVIMMVNGSVGTGVAIMGAFSLVRFRSNPGNAKDICAVFFSMAVGLATGMGYISFAVCMVVVIGLVFFILTWTRFGEEKTVHKMLRIVIPESLDYTGAFDDIFKNFTEKAQLEKVKTTNMGSMYELSYRIVLKDETKEKEMIDEIRCRNGNLSIICGKENENQYTL